MTVLDRPSPPRSSLPVLRLFVHGVHLVGARLVGMALTLLMIPIAIGSMTTEAFGLWMTIASVSAVVALFNLGIGNALVSMVARAADDVDELRRIVSTGFVLAGCGGLAAVAVFGGALLSRNWAAALGLVDISDAALQLVLLLCLLAFALTMPLGTIINIRQGQERHDLVATLTVIASLAAFGLVAIGAAIESWQLIVVSQFAGMLIATILAWGMHRARPAVPAPRRQFVDRSLAPAMLRSGSHYFGLQLAAVVAFSSDNIVAAKLFGAAGVGDYAVPARIATTALALLALPAVPLWSAVARSLGAGDDAWIEHMVTRLRIWLPVLALATFGAFAVVVGPMSSLLSNGEYRPAWDLRLWLAAFVAIGTVGNWIAAILNGLSLTRMQLTHSAVMAAANIVLSVFLARRMGVVGLAAGSAISYLIFLGGPYYYRLGTIMNGYSSKGADR